MTQRSQGSELAAHIALNRFGYGLKLGEIAPANPATYLLAQLDQFDPEPQAIAGRGDMIERPGEILEMLRRLRRERQNAAGNADMASMEAMDDRRGNRNTSDPFNGLPDEVRQSYRRAGESLRADIGLRTNLAIASQTPFVERLVHFWSNHFSVSAQKPGTHFLVANHEFHAIRPHVTGKFADMLKAAVLHPAMLIYLDQFRSVGPNSRFQQFRARQRGAGNGQGDLGLNENLAREVLELHTLGVDGGYSQADVTELAQALTGWTIAGIRRLARFTEDKANGAAYAAPAHEPGTRQIMGQSYRDNGASQAIAVLDDLATHPATARFIATKLARHFAGDAPPESLIARLEQDFNETGGDLGSLSRALVASPEVWVAGPVKYRQPFEWLVSVLRLTGNNRLDSRRLSGALDQLGQLPWRAPSPAGYDDLEGSWAGPDALFRRVELAERIARGARADNILEHAHRAFPEALSDHTSTWLARAESPQQALGLLLVSPEMLRR